MRSHSRNSRKTELDARSVYLRKLVLDALEGGGRGHLASALSLVEIVRVLYDDILIHKPDQPQYEDRDRFVLSKGHGCLGLYAVLADYGYFPVEELHNFCKFDSILGGHPELVMQPGVEFSTGSLGHGLPVAVGFAMASRLKGAQWRTFILMGDGELNEGSVWEALLHASKHRLNSLTVIVDYNQMQASGLAEEVLLLSPLHDKFLAFGFDVAEVNGHNISELRENLIPISTGIDKPRVVIAHTVKGKGIKSAESSTSWHHKAKITKAEISILRKELGVES